MISPNPAICSSPCGTNKQCIAPDNCTCVSSLKGIECLTNSATSHVPASSPIPTTPYDPSSLATSRVLLTITYITSSSPKSIIPYVPSSSATSGFLSTTIYITSSSPRSIIPYVLASSTTPYVPSFSPTLSQSLNSINLTTYLITIITVVIVILLLSISLVIIIIVCLKRRKRIQTR